MTLIPLYRKLLHLLGSSFDEMIKYFDLSAEDLGHVTTLLPNIQAQVVVAGRWELGVTLGPC